MELDNEVANHYWLAITMIEAQNCLVQLRVSSNPWMKPADQRKIHKELHRQAYPGFETTEVSSTEDMAKKLAGALNGR